ncbi:DEAD/DEAH box helicase domain-containing protein, partial [Phenoliferia sp. Uapishka_3]
MAFLPSKLRTTAGGGLISTLVNSLHPVASTSALPFDSDVDSPIHPLPSNSNDRQRSRSSSVDSNKLDDDDVASPTKKPAAKRRKVVKSAVEGEPAIVVGPKLKSKAPAKGKGKAKAKGKAKEPEFVTDLVWPDHFVKLEKTFKALNTVYTFCSARKSMATTYETLKGGVENLLRRPLEIHDIAQIKSLLPSLITFAYIDSELLRVHSAGGDEEEKKKQTRRQEKARELDEDYERLNRANANGDSAEGRGWKKEKEIVLLFSFNDGELKAANGVGKVVTKKTFRKNAKKAQLLTAAPTSNPKHTTASMTSLINSRNSKFSSAISELLVACAAHQPPQDPLALLLDATEENVPVRDDVGQGDGGKKGLGERKEDLEFFRRNPDMRPSVEELVEELKEGEGYKGQIVENGHRVFDAREAVYGDLSTPLSETLLAALQSSSSSASSSITSLYSHQSLAISHLQAGRNVIVSTSTSSGKSLIYQIPMLQALEEDLQSTGLYIFPTKALAQDQKRGLSNLLGRCEGLEGVRVRMQCEILMKQVRSDLMLDGRSDMASRVMAYRSGYSAEDRRKIEQEMFSGQLLGVIATTALELGIDIGSLDAVITVGFPYTLPGLRQQAGRAGRRNKDSLAMLICDPFPVDQHYANNPDEIFSKAFNSLNIDLENPIVLEAHLQCAADEMPVHPVEDVAFFGERLPELCETKLIGDGEGFFHCHPRYKPYPAKTVPIRATEDDKYDVVDVSEDHDGRPKLIVLEEVEFSRAIFTVYEGAVFMHQGRTFLVKEVNHDRKIAKVALANMNWRTRQRDFTNVDPLEALAIREIEDSPHTASYGTVQIISVVFGYYKTDHRVRLALHLVGLRIADISHAQNNILDVVDISSPPFIRESHGLWIDVPYTALAILALKNLHEGASIHAAEHAIMSLTPIVAMSIEGDVKTECKLAEKELSAAALSGQSNRKRPPRIILYDSSGKSGGICAKAFDHISRLLRQAADTIANCRCLDGCPSCGIAQSSFSSSYVTDFIFQGVASTSCSGANLIVSKLGALVVLSVITGRFLDVDAIPVQEKLEVGGKGTAPVRSQGPLMATEEMGDEEEAERERELASLLG